MSNRQAGARAVIPLFPLGTVLVPGLPLPLHVFEPRYRRLVADLLARPPHERAFGVVAIREGHEVGDGGVRALFDVGTLALVQSVHPYDDGRFDLRTSGGRRFRVLALVDSGTPYHCAEVEWLDEVDVPDAANTHDPARVDLRLTRAAALVRAQFERYRRSVARAGAVEAAQMASLPEDPRTLSYLVSVAVVLDLADRQRLLEAPTTLDRLRAEHALLGREAALLEQLPSLPAVELARTPSALN